MTDHLTRRQRIEELRIEIAERQSQLRRLTMAAQMAGEMREVGVVTEWLK